MNRGIKVKLAQGTASTRHMLCSRPFILSVLLEKKKKKKEQPLNKSWKYAKLLKAFYSLQMVMHLI